MNSLIPSVTIKKEIGIGEIVQVAAVLLGGLWLLAGDHNGQKALAAQLDDVKSSTSEKITGLSGQITTLQQTFAPFAVVVSDVATLKSEMIEANKHIYDADVLARGVAKDVDNIKAASALQLSQPERRK